MGLPPSSKPAQPHQLYCNNNIMANEALYAALQCSFDAACADPGLSPEDRDVLECAVADVADCSAREVITFLLPVLDSHAGGRAGRRWTGKIPSPLTIRFYIRS